MKLNGALEPHHGAGANGSSCGVNKYRDKQQCNVGGGRQYTATHARFDDNEDDDEAAVNSFENYSYNNNNNDNNNSRLTKSSALKQQQQQQQQQAQEKELEEKWQDSNKTRQQNRKIATKHESERMKQKWEREQQSDNEQVGGQLIGSNRNYAKIVAAVIQDYNNNNKNNNVKRSNASDINEANVPQWRDNFVSEQQQQQQQREQQRENAGNNSSSNNNNNNTNYCRLIMLAFFMLQRACCCVIAALSPANGSYDNNNNNNGNNKKHVASKMLMRVQQSLKRRQRRCSLSLLASQSQSHAASNSDSVSPTHPQTHAIATLRLSTTTTLVLCLFYASALLPCRVRCDDGDNFFAVNSFSMGPETTTPEFDYASRGQKKFGDKCDNTLECGFPGSICDPKKKSCQCTEDLPVTNHIDKCGKEAAVNETCFFNEQCEVKYFQTECRDGRCICRFEMSPIWNKDGSVECKGRQDKRGTETYVDPAMIGVLVGMALMFIIICVVLRLFSQARWRENRTIFNTPNPRLMNVSLLRDSKLLHGQERRGSRMSVRAPSRQPSMASLRPHSPNPSLGSGSHGSNASATSVRSTRSNSVAPGNVANNHHERKGSAYYQHQQQQPNITSNPVAESVTVEIIEAENKNI